MISAAPFPAEYPTSPEDLKVSAADEGVKVSVGTFKKALEEDLLNWRTVVAAISVRQEMECHSHLAPPSTVR